MFKHCERVYSAHKTPPTLSPSGSPRDNTTGVSYALRRFWAYTPMQDDITLTTAPY